jgi:hypothetical protein
MSLAYLLMVRLIMVRYGPIDHGTLLTLHESPLRHDMIVRVATTGWPYDAQRP